MYSVFQTGTTRQHIVNLSNKIINQVPNCLLSIENTLTSKSYVRIYFTNVILILRYKI